MIRLISINPDLSVVFSDCTIRQGVFCELGLGEVDFLAISTELKKSGYDGWIVVEQDVLPGMGSPRESAQRNRDYLQSIGL